MVVPHTVFDDPAKVHRRDIRLRQPTFVDASGTSDPFHEEPLLQPLGGRKPRPFRNKAFQIDDLEGFYQWLVGRRDWTRTNDPHHVKVVL